MRIGIDIDGVINDLFAYYIECGTKYCYENNIYTTINSNEYKLYNIFSWNQHTARDFHNKYYKEFICGNRFLRRDAVEVIQKLHNNNEIIIITARTDKDLPYNSISSMKTITLDWLLNNNIPFEHLIFSNVEKFSYIKEMKLDWMIEDNPAFFNDLVTFSTLSKYICYDAPYNRNIINKNIIRAFSWYDILNIINKGGNNNV